VTPKSQAILFIAASEVDSNLYYSSQFLVGDPVAYVEFQGKRILLVNELELGRARIQAKVDEVVSLLPYDQQLRGNGKSPNITDMVELFLRERGIERLLVPATFPVGHADRLRAKSFVIEFRDEPFYQERAIKSADEIDKLSASQAITSEAVSLAIEMIRRSQISRDVLELNGNVLTAEYVRREVHRFLLEHEFHAHNTIVAGGSQACDTHLRGSGPLPAHRPIVLDIFPRSNETRYWGDMTRTVLRGKPSQEVVQLHRDVLEAQELALSLLKNDASGKEVHESVVELFKSRGRANKERNGKIEGFIHSTGHGIGLDVHEYPKIGRVESALKSGHVVTIEPGLYYSDLGGIRIEDMVVVTDTGHKNLTHYSKELVVG
jgi:Xaa-Pro aminopeptidase